MALLSRHHSLWHRSRPETGSGDSWAQDRHTASLTWPCGVVRMSRSRMAEGEVRFLMLRHAGQATDPVCLRLVLTLRRFGGRAQPR